MAKAFLHWKEINYLNAALKCGDLIWEKGKAIFNLKHLEDLLIFYYFKGLLRKGPGICHGIAGNGYAQLMLYRLTKDSKYLYRASKFAEFLLTETFKEARIPDRPYSLFEGLGGTVCFILDLLDPNNSEFPLFPIF